LLEVLRDYDRLNFDTFAIKKKLSRELESYKEIPSYEPENIKGRIRKQISSENLNGYDERKLKKNY